MKIHLGPYTDSDEPRLESIEIHKYDSWNAFETIAKVAYPILVQLKATKQGYALVDPQDAMGAYIPDMPDNPDEFSEKNWDCVLDEIIWTMKELAENEPNAPSYDTMNFNSSWLEDLKVYNTRIQKGCELFGKYFRNL
jgi:hypothetical protein